MLGGFRPTVIYKEVLVVCLSLIYLKSPCQTLESRSDGTVQRKQMLIELPTSFYFVHSRQSQSSLVAYFHPIQICTLSLVPLSQMVALQRINCQG